MTTKGNSKDDLKFHSMILLESMTKQDIHFQKKQVTKRQIHTLSIFSNTSTVEGFACLQGKEQRH